MRGVWTAVGLSFTVIPYSCILIYMIMTGRRSPAIVEEAFLTVKHLTEVSDPIILLVLDIRFRAAAKEVLSKWVGIHFATSAVEDQLSVASKDLSVTDKATLKSEQFRTVSQSVGHSDQSHSSSGAKS
ncbi:hypothetical protein BC828DRAFT_412989 [Blastocladiella britannica]|nr:hypothetical protein BC828DRAFT_412989 [Blastocladiella britannica]